MVFARLICNSVFAAYGRNICHSLVYHYELRGIISWIKICCPRFGDKISTCKLHLKLFSLICNVNAQLFLKSYGNTYFNSCLILLHLPSYRRGKLLSMTFLHQQNLNIHLVLPEWSKFTTKMAYSMNVLNLSMRMVLFRVYLSCGQSKWGAGWVYSRVVSTLQEGAYIPFLFLRWKQWSS